MFSIQRTCSDAELIGDKLFGRRPASITVNGGALEVAELTAAIAKHDTMWTRTQKADFACVMMAASKTFPDFLISLFQYQVKLRSHREQQFVGYSNSACGKWWSWSRSA